MGRSKKVVMLCGQGRSSRAMYHGLAKHINIVCVMIEEKPSTRHMIKRRIKKLGVLKVLGQIFFLIFNKLASKLSQSKIENLIAKFDLIDSSIPPSIVRKVKSINHVEAIDLLKEYDPDAVLVNGTRILSPEVLASVSVPFLNTHMGITPKYRGVHGGYWALAMGDTENCGVTVHLVDRGIDTGGVLYQDTIHPTKDDNFNTYPIHQMAAAIPLMRAAIADVCENRIKSKQGVLPSRLWYHPTLWGYLFTRIRRGVK